MNVIFIFSAILLLLLFLLVSPHWKVELFAFDQIEFSDHLILKIRIDSNLEVTGSSLVISLKSFDFMLINY